MTQNEKFLDAYRLLDTELKFDNKTVLDYENDTLNGLDQEKLKVCRIMRNYLAHNDTKFLDTSNEQIKFLTNLVTTIRKSSSTVKDFMKKPTLCKTTEPIKNYAKLLDKFNYVPITTSKGLYLVDKDIYINQLAKGNKKIIPPARLPKYNYTIRTERIENLSEGIYIVTSDGTSNGIYNGIIIV